MLKLFKTKLAAIPFVVIFMFMIGTRAILYFNSYSLPLWSNPLSPFSLGLKNSLDTLSSRLFLNLFISFILVSLQINLVSLIAGKLKSSIWKNFITPWLYILFISIHPSFLLLSPQLISLTFILASINALLKIDNTQFYIKHVFMSSLFVGLAAAFWMPSFFFLLISLFYIQQNNILNLRNVLLTFIGFVIPFIYTASFMVFTEKTAPFFNNISLNKSILQELNAYDNLSFLFVLLLSIAALFKLNSFIRNQLKETKVFFTMLLIYLVSFILAYVFHFHKEINVWIYIAFPVSLLINIFFNSFKRFFIAEIIHVTLLLIILVNFIHLIN